MKESERQEPALELTEVHLAQLFSEEELAQTHPTHTADRVLYLLQTHNLHHLAQVLTSCLISLQHHLLTTIRLHHNPTHHDLPLLERQHQQSVLVRVYSRTLLTNPSLLLVTVIGCPVRVNLRSEFQLAN